MKVLLDPQIFNDQKFGGISRYFAEVLIELKNDPKVEVDFPIVYTNNFHLKEVYNIEGDGKSGFYKMLSGISFLKKKYTKKLHRYNIKRTEKHLKNQNFDVFVPTYYGTYFLKDIGKKSFVLTVYDMIHEVLPQYFTKDKFTVKNKLELMEKATKIIAISESTKNDILKIYPHIDGSKIDVVYLSDSIDPLKSANVDLPKKYILFVGNRADYKNFDFFLKSVAPILKADPELYLVCAGGNGFTSKEVQHIESLKVGKQLIQQNFGDSELATYYKNALLFVFPSEYEGFGIPVLESMSCGCPVVLARHSSFPEVAGDAGVYFELGNENYLREKVQSLISNPELRKEFSEKGLAQAKKFSWKKTARECLEVYKSAI